MTALVASCGGGTIGGDETAAHSDTTIAADGTSNSSVDSAQATTAPGTIANRDSTPARARTDIATLDVVPMELDPGTFHAIRTMTYHPTGSMIFIGSNDPEGVIVHLLDPDNGLWQADSMPVRSGSCDLTFNASGEFFAVAECMTGDLSIWNLDGSEHTSDIDAQMGQVDKSDTYADEAWSVDWHPTRDEIVTGSTNGRINVWDLAGNLINSIDNAHSEFVTEVAYDKTGELLASGGFDGAIRLWDAKTYSPSTLTIDRRGNSPIWVLQWSPSGDRLAGADRSGVVYVWDSATGELIWWAEGAHSWVTNPDYGQPVRSLTWSADGDMLASGGQLEDIVLWDTKNGTPIGRLVEENASQPIWSLLFTPDSKQLLSGTDRGKVKLWDISVLTVAEPSEEPQDDSEAGSIGTKEYRAFQVGEACPVVMDRLPDPAIMNSDSQHPEGTLARALLRDADGGVLINDYTGNSYPNNYWIIQPDSPPIEIDEDTALDLVFADLERRQTNNYSIEFADLYLSGDQIVCEAAG